jgi:cytochrome c553
MKTILLLLIGLLAHDPVLSAQTLEKEGALIARQGNGKGLMPCGPCHGEKGEGKSVEGFPQLAGLSADYLQAQIEHFRSGARQNPVMQAVAQMMEESDSRKLAAYFASLKPQKPGSGQEAQGSDSGLAMATVGLWNKGVPACFACHGPDGAGVGSAFPRITWQPPAYLITQLKSWKNNTRKGDPNGLMKNVADKLSEAEIQSVAQYLSTYERRK